MANTHAVKHKEEEEKSGKKKQKTSYILSRVSLPGFYN